MSGLIQAYVEMQGQDGVVNPVACPLADAVPEVERAGLRCWREYGDQSTICCCPYAARLHEETEPTRPLAMWTIMRRMESRGLRTARVRILCLAARAATRPGC